MRMEMLLSETHPSHCEAEWQGQSPEAQGISACTFPSLPSFSIPRHPTLYLFQIKQVAHCQAN